MDKNIYINCSYIPPELFVAAGLKPVRLWPEEIAYRGQNFIPVDICPYTRAILSQLYGNKKAVLANSCDGMRRLYDVITDNSFLLEVPRKSSTNEVKYFYQQLLGLLDFLDINYDNKYRQRLKKVIRDYNIQRNLLQKIQKQRSALLLLKGIKIYSSNKEGSLQELVETKEEDEITPSYPSVLLTSSCLLDGQIVETIVKNNLHLAAIDSCLGERSFNFQINIKKGQNPLKVLARKYLQKSACPRSMEVKRRIEEINKIVKKRKIEGIIYFTPKFCDQAAYDFKIIKKWAINNNIPLLNLEGEYKAGQSGQLNTRIAAFRESLTISG